jgi:hypothetical protein
MSLNHAKVLGAIVFASALVVALGVNSDAQTPVPGLGTWKLNLAKSKFSPGPAPKSAMVTFTAAGQATPTATWWWPSASMPRPSRRPTP